VLGAAAFGADDGTLLQVTLTAAGGVLSGASVNGVTVTDGASGASKIFTGTAAALSAYFGLAAQGAATTAAYTGPSQQMLTVRVERADNALVYTQSRTQLVAFGPTDAAATVSSIRSLTPDMAEAGEDERKLEQAVEAGAQGSLTKNVVYDELVAAIRDAHAGGRPIAKKLQRTAGGESNAGLLTRLLLGTGELVELVRIRQPSSNNCWCCVLPFSLALAA
jgi:hypothetical protein